MSEEFCLLQKQNVYFIGVDYGTLVLTLCLLSHLRRYTLLLRNTCQVCIFSVPHESWVSWHVLVCSAVVACFFHFSRHQKSFTVFSFSRPPARTRFFYFFFLCLLICKFYFLVYILVNLNYSFFRLLWQPTGPPRS